MKKTLSIFLLIISAFFTHSFETHGQSSPAFTINANPESNLLYDTTPGSTIKDYIILKNLDKERWVELSITPKNMPDRWMRMETNIIRLEPDESKEIIFSVTIPKTAELKNYKSLFILKLNDFEKEEIASAGVGIAIAIAKDIKINIVSGEINNLDYTKGLIKTVTETENIPPKTKSTKEIINDFYVLIQNNLNILLLIIILGLLLKLAFVKKITPQNISKTVKTPKKKTTPKKIQKGKK